MRCSRNMTKSRWLDRRRGVVEGEEIRERGGVGGRLLERAVLVEAGHHPDGLRHEVVDVADAGFGLAELGPREALRVALLAGPQHLAPLGVEGALVEPGDLRLVHHREPGAGCLRPSGRGRRAPAGWWRGRRPGVALGMGSDGEELRAVRTLRFLACGRSCRSAPPRRRG
jgi:hypothetical protein